jgi:acyl carrier protein
MNQNEFLDLIADELLIAPNSITLETEFRQIPTWTSLNSLLVISKIHEVTGIMVSAKFIAESTTLSDIYQLVQHS